jgi:hypothetical protein
VGGHAAVERNDSFAFGSYGRDTPLYADVLIGRWLQLLALADAAE